jgi:hypothetical protein
MHRPIASFGFVALLLAAAAACGRETQGTTTVTSGSTSGVRVTGARVGNDDAAMRLADELCNRASACNRIGDGAPWRTLEACMADEYTRTPAQVGRWTCTPFGAHVGFEECLVAVRSERCDTDLRRADALPECRNARVCARP